MWIPCSGCTDWLFFFSPADKSVKLCLAIFAKVPYQPLLIHPSLVVRHARSELPQWSTLSSAVLTSAKTPVSAESMYGNVCCTCMFMVYISLNMYIYIYITIYIYIHSGVYRYVDTYIFIYIHNMYIYILSFYVYIHIYIYICIPSMGYVQTLGILKTPCC